MQLLDEHFHPQTTDPSQLQTSWRVSVSRAWTAVRIRGRQTQWGEGAHICIVPLQSPTQERAQGWGLGVGGGEGQEGPLWASQALHFHRPLPWVVQEKHACRRPSPSGPPPQGEDVINCRHRTRQGAGRPPQQASLYASQGKSGPGPCWDRRVGKCLVMLGAGYTVFPKHGSLWHHNQGPPPPSDL